MKQKPTRYLESSTHLLALTAGAAYILLTKLMPDYDSDSALLAVFGLSFFPMAAVGFALGRRAPSAMVSMSFLAFVGLSGAVIADAIYDSVAHGIDRNLLPFEIAWHAFFAIPGLMVSACKESTG